MSQNHENAAGQGQSPEAPQPAPGREIVRTIDCAKPEGLKGKLECTKASIETGEPASNLYLTKERKIGEWQAKLTCNSVAELKCETNTHVKEGGKDR